MRYSDFAPREGQLFPLTKFIPRAVFIEQGVENPHRIDLTEAIRQMQNNAECHQHVDHESSITV